MMIYKRCTAVIHIFMLGVLFLLINSCDKNELIDPFWSVDLKADLADINESLYKESKAGKILDCVFSFDKEFYIKGKQLDAKIKASLDHPTLVNDEMKITYSLIAEFKDDNILDFNPDFYEYFKTQMISTYGPVIKENMEENNINLNWKLENKISIKAFVIKDINVYMVSILKKE